MKVTERTINVGEIGSKNYIENLNMILSVYKSLGFKELEYIEKGKDIQEKLVIHGYTKIGFKKEVVKELYK